MAANTTPIFPGTIKNQGTTLVKDAPAVDIWTAGTNGSRLDKLLIKAAAVGTVRLFITDGTTTMEVDVIDVSTEMTDVFEAEKPWFDRSLWLGMGWSLLASADQDTTTIAYGGDY